MYQGNCALSLESHWEKLAANDETASGELVHTDHLGTPRRATDETGTVIWAWDSDPFGATAPDEDPDGDGTNTTINLRFSGQYFDQETGLHYNYFRTYDPSTGRYLTSDPIGLNGGLNTYGYVGGNPLRWKDTFGLKIGYIDPVFDEHIKNIRGTKKGEELWQNMVDNPRTINIYSGSNHCANATDLRDPKNIDVYVFAGNHDHLKLSGFRDGEYVQYTPSVTRSLAHELGHTTGTQDDGGSRWHDFWADWDDKTFRLNNVNEWENGIMTQIDGITRTGYSASTENRCGCRGANIP